MTPAVTSGSGCGTGGGSLSCQVTRFLRRHRAVLALLYGVALLTGLVNAVTANDDLAAAGVAVAAWEPWAWEVSSLTLWLILMPAIGALTLALRRLSGVRQALLMLAATLPLSALHVAGMVWLRHGLYALGGAAYRFDWRVANLFYEWRKDLVSITIITLAFHIGARLRQGLPLRQNPGLPSSEPPPLRLEVRDQGRIWWLAPADILWAAAAGNCVELHTVHGPLLHRVTLAALAETLSPHGFARIHRGRLVRTAGIVAVAPTPSGDFTVTLNDGTSLNGSRRYRAGL